MSIIALEAAGDTLCDHIKALAHHAFRGRLGAVRYLRQPDARSSLRASGKIARSMLRRTITSARPTTRPANIKRRLRFFNTACRGLTASSTRIPQLQQTESARARPFRNEVDGFVSLSRYRSAVLRREVELHRNDLTKVQNDFEISESDAFAAPGLHLVSRGFGLTAESGINDRRGRVQDRGRRPALFGGWGTERSPGWYVFRSPTASAS